MQRVIIGLGLALVALLAYVASNLIPASGAFTTLTNRLVDDCTALKVFPGTEDVTIDPDTNLAFVSADDRRATMAGDPVPGGIYVFDVDKPDSVRKVSPDDFGDFHPHGISLWRAPDGEKRLFVVNHRAGGVQAVEIFDVGENGALTHLVSVTFPLLKSPNDLLAVGSRQFYVTNDHMFTSGVMAAIENWLALPLSNVVYFDGSQARVAAKGLAFANGINASADGAKVYVSEFLRRRVVIFDRNATTGDLKRAGVVPTPMGPDNIEVADDGALWVAGHPKVFDFLKHAKDPKVIAPSEVVHINPSTKDTSVVFIDTTGKLNASSVGAVSGKTLIVGAVFDDHVMVCPMVETILRGAGGGETAN
ncbi:MAG TPA: SMP-30/gluconolactonase/LRE family protein [Parvularculaceae bacterium]|nr:SMP-30/gluconolactonase/LRE family protein [Parvularculaceae bacterium]